MYYWVYYQVYYWVYYRIASPGSNFPASEEQLPPIKVNVNSIHDPLIPQPEVEISDLDPANDIFEIPRTIHTASRPIRKVLLPIPNFARAPPVWLPGCAPYQPSARKKRRPQASRRGKSRKRAPNGVPDGLLIDLN